MLASSRTTPGALRSPKWLARSRADYEQDSDMNLPRSRIPQPAGSHACRAIVRGCSAILKLLRWVMTKTCSAMSAPLASLPIATQLDTSTAARGSDQTKVDDSFAESSLLSDGGAGDINDTSLMLADNTFDESLDPEQQTSDLILFGRKLAGMKRLGMGLTIDSCPWFNGLAISPTYTGDSINKPRVRPRRRPIQRTQLHGQ